MKKFIAMAALLAAGTAFAGGFGSVTYGDNQGVGSEGNSKSYTVKAGVDLTDSIKLDASSQTKSADTATDNGSRVEGGVTYSQPIVGALSGYGRVGLGQKYTSSENHSYYNVEPGIKYAVNNALSVKLGYRFQDATDNTAHTGEQTRTWRTGAEYALTKNYFVGVGYDRTRGDSKYDSYTATVGFKY